MSKPLSQVIEDAGRFFPRADTDLSRIADGVEEIAQTLKAIERHFCPDDPNRPDPFSVLLEDR